MKVLMRQGNLSPEFLSFLVQIGCDGIDIHNAESVPGLAEQGYPHLEEFRILKRRINDAGLEIYRVAPAEPQQFLRGEPGGEEQLDQLVKTIEILGQLDIPFMSVPVHMAQTPGNRHFNPAFRGGYQKVFRGGYTMGGFNRERMEKSIAEQPLEPFSVEDHWNRSVQMYERLVPVAENHNVKLIIHPSDPPIDDAEFSPKRWFDILEAVPSDHSGLLYCIGTRIEAVGDGILDDIREWGRKGKIFHTHFRNVQGSVPAGDYAECALDDGDINMFTVLQTLQEVVFDGGLQMDHVPHYTDDQEMRASIAYAGAYTKGMLKALDA